MPTVDAQVYLNIPQINAIFQGVAVGITLLDKNQGVRIDWPPRGAPDWKQNEDVCFVQTTSYDDQYDRLSEEKLTLNPDMDTYTRSVYYTRCWDIHFIVYGPNSWDNARKLKTAFLHSQGVHDTLAASNLYLITDIPTPVRGPELFNSIWWERVDLHVRFNEGVVENDVVPTIVEAEVKVYTQDSPSIDDPARDIVVNAD